MTDAQLEQYRVEGYAVGGRILDDDEMARLRTELDAIIESLPPDRRRENLPSLHYENEYLRDLFLSDQLVDVAEHIVGPDVALFTAGYMTLDLGYTHGGLNLDRHFRDYAILPFDVFVGRRLLEPSPVYTREFLYTGLGMGIATLLMVLRTRFGWWPRHPVALP